VKQGEVPTEGIARGIGADGALLVEGADGVVHAMYCGEVLQWA
jgi:biotin-(acetyl-CoA carboxylase) ligase